MAKVEQGLRVSLVVTPVGARSKVIDGLSEVRAYLDGLPSVVAPTAPPLGSKENPHDTGGPSFPRSMDFQLHPRVLNDYSLPKEFRDAAAKMFQSKAFITLVDLVGPVQRTVVDNGKGQYYAKYTVPVKTAGWDKGFKVELDTADLFLYSPSTGTAREERRRYRVWKDAQLKEAGNLTKKRIMAALAGPKDARLKMGDRLKRDGFSWIFVGYVGTGGNSAILQDPNTGVVYTTDYLSRFTKVSNKEAN